MNVPTNILNIAKSIESYVKIPEETNFLWERALKAEAGIIEIGSWTGRSSLILASAAKEKRIPFIAVDTWQDCDIALAKDFYPIWKENMIKAGFLKKDFKLEPDDKNNSCGFYFGEDFKDNKDIRVYRMQSHIAARLINQLGCPPGKKDFLFIDADHLYEEVKRDFFSWIPNLLPGSTVVFHDINCGHEGPRQFFKELSKECETEKRGNIGAVLLP